MNVALVKPPLRLPQYEREAIALHDLFVTVLVKTGMYGNMPLERVLQELDHTEREHCEPEERQFIRAYRDYIKATLGP